MVKSAAPLSEADLLTRLRERYSAPQYAFLSHVRNATGWSRTTRTADALAMSLWPSRGLHITGFEIKSSRHDWVRELENPQKADEIAGRVDFWVVVLGHADIIKAGELTPTWGLLVPGPRGTLTCAKEPTLNPDAKEITRPFLAAILRRTSETAASKVEVAAAVKAQREKITQEIESRLTERAGGAVKKLADIEAKLDAFRAETGIQAWEIGADLGKAMKLVHMQRYEINSLKRAGDEAARFAQAIAERVAAFEALGTEETS